MMWFFFIQTIRFTKECRCSAGTCKAAFIWLTFGKQFNILCPFYNFQPSKLKKLYYDCMKPLYKYQLLCYWFKVKNAISFKSNKHLEGGDTKGKHKSLGWNHIFLNVHLKTCPIYSIDHVIITFVLSSFDVNNILCYLFMVISSSPQNSI